MDQRRPWALCFDGSENSLMIRGGLTRANGGGLAQDAVFAGDLFQLIEQGGCFRRIFQRGLVLSEPLVAFVPDIALFYIDSLFSASCPARCQFRTRAAQGAEKPVPNDKIEQHDND